MMIKIFPLFLLFVMVQQVVEKKSRQMMDNEKLNMLLVANVSDADAFKKLSIVRYKPTKIQKLV